MAQLKEEGRTHHLPRGHIHSSPLLCHVSRHPSSAAGTSRHTSLQPLNPPCPPSFRCHFAWAPLPTPNYPITICPFPNPPFHPAMVSGHLPSCVPHTASERMEVFTGQTSSRTSALTAQSRTDLSASHPALPSPRPSPALLKGCTVSSWKTQF